MPTLVGQNRPQMINPLPLQKLFSAINLPINNTFSLGRFCYLRPTGSPEGLFILYNQ